MYQQKFNSILLINTYLTMCKIKKSNTSKIVQKYLTHTIDQTLKSDSEKSNISIFSILSLK